MKWYFRPVLDWLGYSRRERRASVILLVIIIITIMVRYVVPERNTDIEELIPLIEATTGIDKPVLSNNIEKKKLQVSEETGAGRSVSYAPDSEDRSGHGINGESLTKSSDYHETRGRKPVQGPIDLNGNDSLLFETLPGIGPVLSARIVKYGNLLGGYASVEQLKEVYGLPLETYDRIKGMVYADSTNVRKVNINTAGFSELIRLRYLSKYEVNAILKFRKLMGRIHTIKELVDNKLIPEEKAGKIRPYISFE